MSNPLEWQWDSEKKNPVSSPEFLEAQDAFIRIADIYSIAYMPSHNPEDGYFLQVISTRDGVLSRYACTEDQWKAICEILRKRGKGEGVQ